MPDKKFLGLGFTFTANDKGLQKKLQSISTLVSDISDGLSDVNGQFAKMSGPKNLTVKKKTTTSKSSSKSGGGMNCCSDLVKIGNLQNFYLGQVQKSINAMHSTLRNRSFGGGTARAAPHLKLVKPITPATSPISGVFEDIENKISKNAKDFLESIEKSGVLGKKGIESFRKNLADLSIRLDEAGNFSGSTERRIKELILAATNADKTLEKTNKNLYAFKFVLGAIGDYLDEIKSSGDAFLKSIGLDFAKIIPEQFKAAGKFAATLISGPFKFVSKLLGFKKKSEEVKELERIKTVLNKLSGRVGGPGTRTKNLYSELTGIDENTKPKDKAQGFFGKIKDFLASLFEGLGAAALFLLGPLKWVGKAFGLIGDALKFVLSPFKNLAKFLPDFASGLGRMIARFTEIAAAIYVFSAAISGAISGFTSTWPLLKEGLQDFWKGIKDISGAIIGWLESFTVVKKAVDLLGDGLMVLWKVIRSGWEALTGLFTGWTGQALSGLGKGLSSLAENINKTQTPGTPSNVIPFPDKSDDLRDSLLKTSKNQIDAYSHQSGILKQMVDRLDAMIDIQSNRSNTVPPQIKIGIDSRRLGLQIDQQGIEKTGAARTQ